MQRTAGSSKRNTTCLSTFISIEEGYETYLHSARRRVHSTLQYIPFVFETELLRGRDMDMVRSRTLDTAAGADTGAGADNAERRMRSVPAPVSCSCRGIERTRSNHVHVATTEELGLKDEGNVLQCRVHSSAGRMKVCFVSFFDRYECAKASGVSFAAASCALHDEFFTCRLRLPFVSIQSTTDG